MRYQHFLLAVFVSFLCGAGLAHAQQAESVTPGQTQPPEVKEFQGYEDQWSNAVVKNDQYTMEFLLSPLYVDISSQGDVTTRNQQIAQLFQKGDEPVSLQQRVVSVRLFGDTAVVSGTYIVRWRANGSTREERGIFTHIYNRARNHWACVNAQRTAVVDLTPGKQKTSQKKSDASEPFHIPLLYQGAQPSQSASGQNSSTQPPN
ncbi:MAG: nuclear transport factor 2 family protein [Acidobacteriaceae bacterium]|jgi:ketosteroid isomerase-like protein